MVSKILGQAVTAVLTCVVVIAVLAIVFSMAH